MKRRFLSLLLAVVLIITSFDMTIFAAEKENDEIICTQEVEAGNVAEQAEQAEQIGQTEVINEIEVVTDTEVTENVVEEIKTIEDVRRETFTENIGDEDAVKTATEIQEGYAEIEQNKETVGLLEDVWENDIDISVEETQRQVSETEEEIKSSGEEERGEEIQTEETIVGSSAGLNTAMKNKILGLKSKYPEGKNWDPNGNGWRNLAWECYGFVITMEGLIFKDYPTNKHLRSTLNGKTVEGWTCYYVTNSNYNSLVVEPGDILDCPTSTQWNHTAMVLSVDNGKITCVQANYNGNNLVYWTQCFNYSTKRSTLKNIYSDYAKYITGSGSKVFRLWKPSEDLKKQATGYSETPAASTLKISGQSSPGNLKTGERWACTGTISSNYTITHVGGYILQSDHSTVAQSKTIKPNAKSYSLPNGAIDQALLFNELPEGTYYYKITAHDESGKRLTLIDNKFTVTSPAPKPCNFSGQITSPAEGAAYSTSKIKITAAATDTYAINNFVIKLFWNGTQKTETIAATISGNSYVCNYNLSLPAQAHYKAEIYAACANGVTHKIGERSFIYDAVCPVISDFKVYEDKGDFWYASSVNENIGISNSWLILKDGAGTEKRFECGKDKNIFIGTWSDISGLRTYGKYTITFYAQDYAGNLGWMTLHDIVLAEATTDEKKVYLTVGEEKEVKLSVNTLFKTEGKAPTEKTDTGMRAILKPMKPGYSIFRFEWIAKNNAFSTNHDYNIFVYVVPQAPEITEILKTDKGYDIIFYDPVPYAKTYELYCKRIGIDADYQLWEEFSDNKSHSINVKHEDKTIDYCYRLRVKAEETVDGATGEKYYPTSAFSNDVYSKGEESSEREESPTESDSILGNEDIADGLYISGLESKTYTGSAIKQDIKVYYNKTLLKEKTDYTLSYKNNINAGTALLTIKAKGNLTGSVTKEFKIEPREITDRDVIIENTAYTYNKKVHKKAPKVTYKGKVLKEKKDFEVTSYGEGNYTDTGTYTVTIKGIGNFKGTFENAKIIITEKNKNIGKATLAKIPVQEYQNGSDVILPDELIKVTIAGTVLKKDTDYTVSYANNIHPGKATLIIKGMGEYVGTKNVNFTVKRTPIVLTKSMVTNMHDMNTVSIQKNGAMPKPKLVSKNKALTEGSPLVAGRDYVLSYKNNKKPGTGSVIIKGKGNYSGSLEIPFNIVQKELTSADITIRVPNVPYSGKANRYQSMPVITDSDGGMLIKNKDYTIESYYEGETMLDKGSNPKKGTEITVTINGKGSYTGTAKATYKLEGISLSKAVIKVAPKSYTGKFVALEAADITSAAIKIGKTKNDLKLGKDYEIAAYHNNLKKGIATVTFRGIGDYSGEKTVKFKIMPAAISTF